MNYLAIPRTRFSHLHVNVFFEVGRDLEILILVGSGSVERELIGHLQDYIRLSNRPSFGELRGGRQILRVALLCTLIDPRSDSVDLSRRKAAIVCEFLIV